MSHASNKVDWCLNKAKKEVEQAGIHRGLVKVSPDVTFAEKHIAKAEHNLNAAAYFRKGSYSDWSASAFFYCLYHCLLAILRKHGYESRNQECTLAAIAMLKEEGKITIDSKFINTLEITKSREVEHSTIKIRENLQYGVEVEFSRKEEFEELNSMCRELIEITKGIIHG